MQEVQRPIFDDDPALMQFREEKRRSDRSDRVEAQSSFRQHLEWLQQHPTHYRAWIEANYGNMANFQEVIRAHLDGPKQEDFTGKELPEDVAARRKKLQLLDQNIAKRKRK